jgi:DNA repair exonuclease SbcCD nuclease subunit
MKVAIITDQHFGARNDSVQFLDFYQKFYDEIFFPKLLEEKIDTVLILGDTFDRRKYVNFYTYKRTKEMFFDKLFNAGITVYMLAGNHDTYFKNTNEVNSIRLLLQQYNNITVIDKPSHLFLDPTDEGNNSIICMIPWICPENYVECLSVMQNSEASVCCGHFEISGFAMYRGMPSEEGLNRELFRKFDYTFSGHYHHKSDADGIYYLGNPYEITWQDFNDTRGFHLFDLDTRELEFVPNTNRMFHKLPYDDKRESITDVTNKDLSQYTNTYVKVVVVNKTNPYLFDRFMENLYKVNPIDVTIAEDFTDLTEGVDDDIVDQAEDTLTIINKYVDGIAEEHIDNNKLKNILKELYIEALNEAKQ